MEPFLDEAADVLMRQLGEPVEEDYELTTQPEPHQDFWMLFSRLGDPQRSDRDLKPLADMDENDTAKVLAARAALGELEGRLSGTVLEYYHWLRRTLWPSQVEGVLQVLHHVKNNPVTTDSNLAADLIAPPGWGKSVVIGSLALPLLEAMLDRPAGAEPFRVLIAMPTKDIRAQVAEKLFSLFEDAPGRVAGDLLEMVTSAEINATHDAGLPIPSYQCCDWSSAGSPSDRLRSARIIITNYHKFSWTGRRGEGPLSEAEFSFRLETLRPEFFSLVMVDESHHAASFTHIQMFTRFKLAPRIFFSATPYGRADNNHTRIARTAVLTISPDYAIKHRMIRRGLVVEYGYKGYLLTDKGSKPEEVEKQSVFSEAEMMEFCSTGREYRKALVCEEAVIRAGVEKLLQVLTVSRARAGVKYGGIIRCGSIQHATRVWHLVRSTCWPLMGSQVTATSHHPTAEVLASEYYPDHDLDQDRVPMGDDKAASIRGKFEEGKLDIIVLVDKWKEGYDCSRINALLYLSEDDAQINLIQFFGRPSRPIRHNNGTWPTYVGAIRGRVDPLALEFDAGRTPTADLPLTLDELPASRLWPTDKRCFLIMPRALGLPEKLRECGMPLDDDSEGNNLEAFFAQLAAERERKEARKEALDAAKRAGEAPPPKRAAGGGGGEDKRTTLRVEIDPQGAADWEAHKLKLVNGADATAADEDALRGGTAIAEELRLRVGENRGFEERKSGKKRKKGSTSAKKGSKSGGGGQLSLRAVREMHSFLTNAMKGRRSGSSSGSGSGDDDSDPESDPDAPGPSTRR